MELDFNDPTTLWRIGGSAAIALVALIIIFWLGALRHRLARKAQESAPAETPKDRRVPGRLAHTMIALAVLAAAAWGILKVWDIDASAWLTQRTGLPIEAVIRVFLIIAAAAALVEVTNFFARATIERIGRRDGDRRRMAKLRTITPLISGLINAMVMLIAIAMVLAQAGIEVAPLLAGAGVAGIAIGFGAQSLVKDLFTGAFLIVEDIVNHGDIVEIGGVSGVVEAMTLRTIRVRSFDGTLHIFPYGEALVIHNKSASFSCFAFEFQISYLSDINTAMSVLERVDHEVRADKELNRSIIGAMELAGVDKLSDNGVIVKGRIRTVAGENGRVGAVFQKLAKERLDEAGVLISHRHLPVPPFDLIRDQVANPKPQPRVATP